MLFNTRENYGDKDLMSCADNFDNIRLARLQDDDDDDLEDTLDLSEVEEDSLLESILKTL